MGKRIDDLPLDDTPLGDGDPDPRASDWYRFSNDIDDLLATGSYTWAEETLQAIQETVEQTKRVTQAQRNAVHNIEASRQRTHASRRYEGWRR
jgi:hypothetical protein